jgi:hypothetical protein
MFNDAKHVQELRKEGISGPNLAVPKEGASMTVIGDKLICVLR